RRRHAQLLDQLGRDAVVDRVALGGRALPGGVAGRQRQPAGAQQQGPDQDRTEPGGTKHAPPHAVCPPDTPGELAHFTLNFPLIPAGRARLERPRAAAQPSSRLSTAIRADSFSRTLGSSLRIFWVSLRTMTSSWSSLATGWPWLRPSKK